MLDSTNVTDRRRDYAELTSTVMRVLEVLQAQGSAAATNVAQLKVVLDTTSEIKEQLTIMNGRVRQNTMDIVAIKSNPPLTRNHCDAQMGTLEKRIREIEGRVPAIVQYLAIAFITGGVMSVASYLLSRLP